MTFKKSAFRAGGIALFVCVATLSSMSPASAHGVGVTNGGESTISENADPVFPLCLQTSNNVRIRLFNTGTINGALATHEALFVADSPFYFGPGGTYSDAMCTTLAAVPGTLSVHGRDVTCTATDATYQRVGTLYTITTTVETACDLKATPGQDDHDSHLTYTGVQVPCGADPITMIDPCAPVGGVDQEFVGVYAQTGTD